MAFGLLFLVVAFFVALPLWTTVCLAGKLATLSEPTLRNDLAVTPINSETYLRAELKKRFLLALVPSALAAFLGILAVGYLVLRPTSDERRSESLDSGAVWLPLHVVIALSSQAVVAICSLLNATIRSCERGSRLDPWRAGTSAVGWGASYLVAYVFLCSRVFDTVSSNAAGYTFATVAMLAAVTPFLVGGFSSWLRLVAAYLVVEVAVPS